MTETSTMHGFAEQQKTAAGLMGAMLDAGADPMLKAQADVLDSVGTAMTDWLKRRQEAVVEAQQLIAQLQEVSGPAELLKAQQEWMAGAFRRMNADAIAYQASAMQLVEKSRNWVGQNAGMPGAPQPVSSRTPGPKSVPVAAKAQ